MPDAAIDACCLIDLCASGQVESILAAAGFRWFIPAAVIREARYIHGPSPDDPSQVVQIPLDLSNLFASGLLTACDLEGGEESQRFVELATLFRSDGEAMALAIAKVRGWTLATDDRKGRREAGSLAVPVVTTPELVKAWADATKADAAAVAKLLRDIQDYARFAPHKTMPLHQWWMDTASK